jgi:hypothetical protein
MAETRYPHHHGAPVRRFPGRAGVYLRAYGEWVRPLRVWSYRGAWRVVCRACKPALIGSGDVLHDDGWPTREAAFAAAADHCKACPTDAEVS